MQSTCHEVEGLLVMSRAPLLLSSQLRPAVLDKLGQTGAPETSSHSTIVNSTRRLFSRPAGVLFVSIGFVCP